MTSVETCKKRISVAFVSDEDVFQHIVPVTDIPQGNRQNHRKGCKSATKTSNVEYENDGEEIATDEIDYVTSSQALEGECENGSSITGRDVFTFQTPKKTGRVSIQVNSPATPHRSSAGSLPGTPRRGHPSSRNESLTPKSGSETPTRKSQIEKKGHHTPTTKKPMSDMKSPLVRCKHESSDESLDTSYDEHDEGHDEQTVASSSRDHQDSTVIEDDEKSSIDHYFDVHSRSANVTSDRTLARLGRCKMDPNTLHKKLSTLKPTHVKERECLRTSYVNSFKTWMSYLCNGFNLLLYGVGSKRKLLEEFRGQHLTDYTQLVINGFFPSLSIKEILNCITADIIGHTGTFRMPIDQVNFIKEHFQTTGTSDTFIIIHNIDGPILRGEKSQEILSQLSQVRGFHFIASVDHINAPLIWDTTKTSRFSWLWLDATTYESYSTETSYENSLLIQQSGSLAPSSLTHVLRSLTPNARGIFILLAQYQLDHRDSSYNGMPFQDLYQRCRERFLVNSNLTLRTQLTEFHDHKLLRSKKGYDGTEYLYIPVQEATIKEFLELQGDS